MKGGCKIYPNKGVKIDPRSITSARMPESLKVYSGYLIRGYDYLKGEGILSQSDIERESVKIKNLPPLSISQNKILSSRWFPTKTHIIEFLRTSAFNYKVYALRTVFLDETDTVYHDK